MGPHYCEERPGAAHSRRDQLSVAGFAPTHPPGAGVNIGRTSVRDASAIPCRGALEVLRCGIGTLWRHQVFYGLAICLFRNSIFRGSPLRGGLGSDRWDSLHLAHIKYFVICVRVQDISTIRAATHQCTSESKKPLGKYTQQCDSHGIRVDLLICRRFFFRKYQTKDSPSIWDPGLSL